MRRSAILALLLLALGGGPALAVGTLEVGILHFRVPTEWEQAPPTGAASAAFELKTGAGAVQITFEKAANVSAAEVMAGWTAAQPAGTLTRWEEAAAGCTVHLVRVRGGAGGGADAMLAALYESRRGLVVVRMQGSDSAVEAATPGFLAVIKKAEDGWKS